MLSVEVRDKPPKLRTTNEALKGALLLKNTVIRLQQNCITFNKVILKEPEGNTLNILSIRKPISKKL